FERDAALLRAGTRAAGGASADRPLYYVLGVSCQSHIQAHEEEPGDPPPDVPTCRSERPGSPGPRITSLPFAEVGGPPDIRLVRGADAGVRHDPRCRQHAPPDTHLR